MKPSLVIVAMLFAATIIAGCSVKGQPDPDAVLSRFGQQLTELQSVNYKLRLDLAGGLSSASKPIDTASIIMNGALQSALNSPLTYTSNIDLSATGGNGPVRIVGQLVGTADYTYFQIDNVSLPSLIPLSLTGEQWYKVKSSQPAALSGQLTRTQQTAIQSLFDQSKPWIASEVLPMTTINGERVYHYRLQMDSQALTSLLASVYQIVGEEDLQLPEISLDNYQPEVFIDTRDYDLRRLIVAGIYTHDHLPTNFSLTLDLDQHNKADSVVPPATVKDIDIAKLLHLPK